MEKGTLVEFRHHNERVLAVVQGTEGKKNLLLEVSSGQVHSVHPRQITFTLPGHNHNAQDIPSFWRQIESLLDPDSLAIAWELLQDERQVLPVNEIAQILFSDTSTSAIYATYRLLVEDRIYFKQKGDSYEPRSATQVKEILHQIEIAQQREQEQSQFEAHLKASIEGSLIDWTPAERSRLEGLERLALYGDEASDRDQAIKLLDLVNFSASAEGAFDALVALGLWSLHENIPLRQSGIPLKFSPEVDRAVQHLHANPPPDSASRRNLTHLHTYTIDDASTRDIDDGLSVEWLENGQPRLWIHIADPTRWIALDSLLDREARRRGTSVYLPEQVLPMFPSQLATGPMSLVRGERRCALSFGIVLTTDGSIDTCEIVPSWISVTYRLTYEDADEMLELGAEAELTALATAAKLRFQWRLARGAINIGLPEQDIKVVDDDPQLRVIEDTPSRQLVAEMMVLTGEATATYAHTHEIPFLYRFQAEPELPPDEELAQIPPGPAYSFALMRCMQRAEMTVVAAPHAGLGLAMYSQVTSPIRRYADYVSHYQLKAFIAGEDPPFTVEGLRGLIAALEPCTTDAVQVERKRKRYWSVEYLRRHRDTPWRAIVLGYLRESENLALVMLDDVAFRCPVRFTRQVDPGEWVHLQVTRADPKLDTLDFQEIEISDDG